MVVATAFLSFACFFVLVAANLDASPADRSPWPAVFTPLWLALGVLVSAPCAHCTIKRRCQSSPLVISLVMCVLLPFMVVSILTAFSSQRDLSIWLILTPLWVIDGCLLCIPSVALALTATKAARQEATLAMRDNSKEASLVVCLGVCVVMPFVATEILLALHLDQPGSVSGRGALAPLMAILAISELLLLLYACSRKPLRPRPAEGTAV